MQVCLLNSLITALPRGNQQRFSGFTSTILRLQFRKARYMIMSYVKHIALSLDETTSSAVPALVQPATTGLHYFTSIMLVFPILILVLLTFAMIVCLFLRDNTPDYYRPLRAVEHRIASTRHRTMLQSCPYIVFRVTLCFSLKWFV